jgi:hypothetical protein
MKKYPEAVQFDVETRELDIAQALAGNSRAILQIGSASDIVRSLLVRESVQEVIIDKHQAKAEDVFKPVPESATGNETVEDK